MFFRFVCYLVVGWLISGSDAESCPDLPPVDNSIFVAVEVKGQIQGTYFCSKGYHLARERTVFCNSSKGWNAPPPKCRLGHCPDPVLANGEVSSLGPVNVSDKITFKCHENYILKGSNWSQCAEDHTWVPPLPVCKSRDCGDPGNLEHGYFEGEDFKSGSTITYYCKEGYRLVGTQDQQCIDGEWNSKFPVCELIPKAPKPALQTAYEKAFLAFQESKDLCQATKNFMQRLKENGLTMVDLKYILEIEKAKLKAKMLS